MTDTAEFPPTVLREYALIADGERGALCGPRGELVWLCAPRWHDDAVFSTLIGGSGVYAVTPVGRYVWGGHYEPGLIWHNRWVTADGTVLECRDALALPADPRRVVILRRIEPVEGDGRVHIVLDLRAAFGAKPMRDMRCADGVWTAGSGELRMRWTGAAGASVDDSGRLGLDIDVPARGHHDLVLEIGTDLGDRVDPTAAWRATEHEWRAAVPALDDCVAPRDARHAYAVLRGLTSVSGGMVAAATMCLPERAGTATSYDYRYAWIRDQCFTGLAVAANGPHPLLRDALGFTVARLVENGPNLKPAYLVTGAPIPDEQPLDLTGYPGGSDVRGNVVTRQFQLDTFGEILQVLGAAARYDLLDREARKAIGLAADVIARRWQDEDAGIWELEDAWWTHSRLACVGGLRVAAEVADRPDARRMRELADAILTETARRCANRDGSWRRTPDDERTDAALLLPALRGGVDADDPHTKATLGAVRTQLVDDGYVYRYPPRRARLGENEGAFLLCGFLLALADAQQGNTVDAFRTFERNRAACGPPGLLAEEFDVEQRQLRGNLPQAFVHSALLQSALCLGSR